MPSRREIEEAREEYTELHEGQPPSRVWMTPAPAVPSRVKILGRLTEIQYRKRVTDGTYPYKHPFGEQHAFSGHAQPLLGLDRRGRLWVLAGRYVVTPHGIEDLPWWDMRREKLPPAPRKRLTTLGKLEFVRYKREADGVVTTEELRFAAKEAPDLAHDERGNLFVLGGQSVDPSIGDTTMARRRRSRRNPTHRVLRTNPARSFGAATKESLMVGGATGLVVLAGAYGMEELFRRVPQLARLSINAQGATKIAAGVLLGGIAGMVGAPSAVAVGLSASGVALGGRQLIDEQRRQMALRQAAAQPPPLNPGETRPGSGVYGYHYSGQYAAR